MHVNVVFIKMDVVYQILLLILLFTLRLVVYCGTCSVQGIGYDDLNNVLNSFDLKDSRPMKCRTILFNNTVPEEDLGD